LAPTILYLDFLALVLLELAVISLEPVLLVLVLFFQLVAVVSAVEQVLVEVQVVVVVAMVVAVA
jgi:hypothetical protein